VAAALLWLGLYPSLGTAQAQAQALAVDLAPLLSEPAGQAAPRAPRCERDADTITLANATLRCRFTTADRRLALRSLYNEFTAREMLLQPGLPALFTVDAKGKRYAGSRDFDLQSLSPVDTGFTARLHNSELGLEVVLQATIDSEGLRLAATFANVGTQALDFRVAFPCLSGLRLSDQTQDDYYYFPWGGGVFSNRPTVMRLGYGDSQALWQVMDVFSPARGGGVYLRVDDAEGFNKTMSLRKVTPGQPEQVADQYMRNTTRPEYLWSSSSLASAEGTGLAVEYLRRTRQPGQSYTPPPAVLAAHAGNWKAAMSAYSAWAHRVWRWRPYPSRLKPVANLGIGGWPDAPLFANGKYRDDFLKPRMDAVELCSWWEWSKLGPGGVPFAQLSPATAKEIAPYLVADPVSGETLYMGTSTDYAAYNDRFGGLAAFRQAIAANRRPDKLITLYTDPFRLDAFNNETGRRFGRKWNFVDVSGKATLNGGASNPCYYLPEAQDWLVATIRRVLTETGADGIRLDEVGHPYGACFAPDHTHVAYQEPGLNEWNKAVADTVRRVRAGMDDVNPAAVLMVEHPGYDYLLAAVDGSISYDLSLMDTWGNPTPESVRGLEVNLQRFYFPECKVFELCLYGRDPEQKRRFWNGVGSFNLLLPTPYHNLYRDNADVYASRDCEALVPTLAPRVYANRFTAGPKTFFHLYNATGKDFSGPVLTAVTPAGSHLFDMLGGQELAAVGTPPTLALSLKPDDVACVALLPALLNVTREGDLLRVSAKVTPAAQRLAVCGLDGGPLLFQDLVDGENRIDLRRVPTVAAPPPAVLKLLDASGQLLDLAAIGKD
jgi:hypothetical protein